MNLCWGEHLNIANLEKTLNIFRDDGYTVLRIWLCQWGIRGIWHDQYLPQKPESAIDLEKLKIILQMCKSFNIKVILTILPHAHFLTKVCNDIDNLQEGWLGNPFIKVAKSPYQFFSNKQIRSYFENFLIHLFSSFPIDAPLFAVELFNEVDLIANIPSHLLVDWHQQMLSCCKNLNPKILLTTSMAVPDSVPKLLELDTLDVISVHNYRWPYSNAIANLRYWKQTLSRFGKPIWVTEFDFSSQGPTQSADSIAYLQSAALAGYCLGYEVGYCPWWWETRLGEGILPKSLIPIIKQWFSSQNEYHFTDLITSTTAQVKYEQPSLKSNLNFSGKTHRYLLKRLWHQSASLLKNNQPYCSIGSDRNFLILIEASPQKPLNIKFGLKGRYRGVCYNISGKEIIELPFEKDSETYWDIQYPQLLLVKNF